MKEYRGDTVKKLLVALSLLAMLMLVVGCSGGVSSSGSTVEPGSAAPAAESVTEPANTEPVTEPVAEPVVEQPAKPALTMGQQQASEKAQSYLDMGGFSRKSLIEQLEYEEFSKADAKYAVDHAGPDWNAQAAEKAQSYLDMGGFSHKSLLEQLEYEGFTSAQAKYGAKAVGY